MKPMIGFRTVRWRQQNQRSTHASTYAASTTVHINALESSPCLSSMATGECASRVFIIAGGASASGMPQHPVASLASDTHDWAADNMFGYCRLGLS